ncbi:MAG: TonB-dependent receptor [Acidobacteriota bacterium]
MRILSIATVLVAVSSFLFAQSDRGTITGTIMDPGSAAVASAPVELRNVQTGAVYQTTSTGTGNYTLPQLPTGAYELSVTVPGFKKFTQQNIALPVAQTLRIDVTLEVGTATESVTVTAEVSLLKTESGELSHNVASQRLNNLPILGVGAANAGSSGIRNPLAVTNLAPGTLWQPNLNVRVNGAPSNTESVRVDGMDATQTMGPFAQAQTQPSVDAVQELSIQTSNYSAEFGQAGGGLFNFTMKSGTNGYHGTGYDYFVNEFLNSGQAYLNVRNKNRRNDYGGTFGGPVNIPKLYNGHDKTFFFVNWEQFRETVQIANQKVTVPTLAYRGGDFAKALTGRALTGAVATDALGRALSEGQIFDPKSEALAQNGRRVRNQFPNNAIPVSEFDSVAKKVQAKIPNPTTSDLFQNAIYPYPSQRVTTIPSIKLDHNVSTNMKASFYYQRTATESQYSPTLGNSEGLPTPITASRGTFVYNNTIRLNVDYTLSPTMLLHLGAGFQDNDFSDAAPVTNYDAVGDLGLRGGTVGPTTGARFPQFNGLTGVSNTGGVQQMGPSSQRRDIMHKPTANASMTWVRNNHTFKIGADMRIEGYPNYLFTNTSGTFAFSAEQTSNTSIDGLAAGGFTLGFPYASFLLGRVSTTTLAAPPAQKNGRQFWALFLQDTWKVTRKLTVDYGLRWDYMSYPSEQYGRTPGFSPIVANPTAGNHPGASIFEGSGPSRCECRFSKNYPYAIGPRIGIAYQITPKTVLRAGWGVSYSSTNGLPPGVAGSSPVTASAPAYGDPSMILTNGIPFTATWPNLSPGVFPAPGTITGAPAVWDNNYGRPARQHQYSIGLQREILANLVVEGSYVGNRGNWWRATNLIDYNALSTGFLTSKGLDMTNAADRTILISQVQAAGAARFRNLLPYSGFSGANSVAQSLRPFPQFGSLPGFGSPLGKTWYDSFQMKVTKRFSHGLDFTYTYTYQKELTIGAESETGGGQVNDLFNRNTNKYISSFSRPQVSVLAVNYTVPKLGGNRWLSYAARDWTLGAVLQYASGAPIRVPNSTGNLNTTLLRSTWAERVPGQALFLQDLNCGCFDPTRSLVLNPAAWREPALGTFSPSAAYYNDYRLQRRPNEAFSFGRIFRVKEGMTLNLRAEFTNPLNRLYWGNPASTAYNTATQKNTAGNLTAGFGFINTGVAPPAPGERQGSLVARFTF